MKTPAIDDLGTRLRRHPVATGLGVALVCVLPAVILLGAGEDGSKPPEPEPQPAAAIATPEGGGPLALLRDVVGLPPAEAAPPAPVEPRGPEYTIANVREGKTVVVYDEPGGRPIGKLGDKTEFGSQLNLWAERSGDGWLGAPVPQLPNGRLAWIRDDSDRLEVYETRYSIRADISSRRLELLYGRKRLESFPVTVGAPGSPTPPGNYAVTDGLAGRGNGPYYGCCILALTGHQSNLPANWLGGDRIAIHGTPDEIGLAASAGCLRAGDTDMVSLFARVPLGTPVFIRV